MSCDQATKAYCERAGAVVAPAFGGDAGSAAGALLQIQELAATRAAEERGGRRGASGTQARIAALQAKAGDEQARLATIAVFRDMQALGISLPTHSEPDPVIGFALPNVDAQHGWRAVREAMRSRPAAHSELANLRAAVGPLADHTRQYLEDDVAAALRDGNTDLAGVVASFERLAGPPKGPLTAAQASIAGAILTQVRDGVPLTDDHLRALWRAYDRMRNPTVDLADVCHTLDIAADNELRLRPVAGVLWALQRWAIHNNPVAGFRYKSDVVPFLVSQGVTTPVTVSSDRTGLIVRLKSRKRGTLPITITIEPNGRRVFAPTDVSAAALALELQTIEDLLEGSEARLELNLPHG